MAKIRWWRRWLASWCLPGNFVLLPFLLRFLMMISVLRNPKSLLLYLFFFHCDAYDLFHFRSSDLPMCLPRMKLASEALLSCLLSLLLLKRFLLFWLAFSEWPWVSLPMMKSPFWGLVFECSVSQGCRFDYTWLCGLRCSASQGCRLGYWCLIMLGFVAWVWISVFLCVYDRV